MKIGLQCSLHADSPELDDIQIVGEILLLYS